MTPLEVILDAQTKHFETVDGDPVQIKVLPGLSEAEIDAFEAILPCPLPPQILRLLKVCRGLDETAVESVHFASHRVGTVWPTLAFPCGLPIAHDGLGNHWVADLQPDSTDWAPIYFLCHDPPVVLFQSPSLEQFLVELFNCWVAPFNSAVDDVQHDRNFNVWRRNPGVLQHKDCVRSRDEELSTFASQLDPSSQIIDMRVPTVGFGFSWGRYGPNTEVRRFGSRPIFAYQQRGLLRRLFGG